MLAEELPPDYLVVPEHPLYQLLYKFTTSRPGWQTRTAFSPSTAERSALELNRGRPVLTMRSHHKIVYPFQVCHVIATVECGAKIGLSLID